MKEKGEISVAKPSARVGLDSQLSLDEISWVIQPVGRIQPAYKLTRQDEVDIVSRLSGLKRLEFQPLGRGLGGSQANIPTDIIPVSNQFQIFMTLQALISCKEINHEEMDED